MVNVSEFIYDIYIGILSLLMHIKYFVHVAYVWQMRDIFFLAHILQQYGN